MATGEHRLNFCNQPTEQQPQPDRQVHVGVEPGVDRTTTKAHVAYVVRDLAAWRTRLSERGVETFDGVPIPGCDRFEFRDPFGNRVEMIAPHAAPEAV